MRQDKRPDPRPRHGFAAPRPIQGHALIVDDIEVERAWSIRHAALAPHDGWLYIAWTGGVSRVHLKGDGTADGAPERIASFSSGGSHWSRSIAFGADGAWSATLTQRGDGVHVALLDAREFLELAPAGLRAAIAHTARAGVHNVQRGMVSKLDDASRVELARALRGLGRHDEARAALDAVLRWTLDDNSSGKDAALQRWVKQVTLAVFDEGHHYVRAGLWGRAVDMMAHARLLLVTATPSRADATASCDACHTRHTFSAEEARQPQACQTCHMGFDHAQWEMMRIERTPNRGPAAARNTGVAMAAARFVAFLDSDDLWLPHHLERCVSALDRNPDVDWVYGACRLVDLTNGGEIQASSLDRKSVV